MLHSYGQLYHRNKADTLTETTQVELLEVVSKVATGFSAHDVAHTVAGLGKLRLGQNQAAEHMRAAVDRACHSMTHQHVAMTLHGFAQFRQDLGDSAAGLMAHLVSLDEAEANVTVQSLVQALGAFAQLNMRVHAAALSSECRNRWIECIAKHAHKFPVDKLVLCVAALGKMKWDFGVALQPLQLAVSDACLLYTSPSPRD